MKLKNIGQKIISIGSTVLMPDGEMTITKTQAETPAILAMVEAKFVTVEEGEKKTAKKSADTDADAKANSTKMAVKETAEKAAAEETSAPQSK